MPGICLLIGHFLPVYSGASLQAFRLLKRLQEAGYPVLVITIQREHLTAFEEIGGIPVYRIRKPDVDWTLQNVIIFWIRLLSKLFRLRKHFEVIHVIGAHLQLSVAGPIARILGKKSIVKLTLARSDLDKLNQGRWGRLQRLNLAQIDRYISISSEITAELKAAPLENLKILEIPNGVDTRVFYPWESKEARLNARKAFHFTNEPLALYVGILNQRKGIDLLIEAWQQVKAQNCSGKLVLVGPEENSAPDFFTDNIKQLISQYRLADSIIFWGQEQDVARLMRACDLLVLPSRSEGLPNVVLEAMASGLPVLASNSAGTETVIESGKDGLVFNIEEINDFSEKLCLLLKKEFLRKELGTAARNRIDDEFSLTHITRRYQELYSQLLNGMENEKE